MQLLIDIAIALLRAKLRQSIVRGWCHVSLAMSYPLGFMNRVKTLLDGIL